MTIHMPNLFEVLTSTESQNLNNNHQPTISDALRFSVIASSNTTTIGRGRITTRPSIHKESERSVSTSSTSSRSSTTSIYAIEPAGNESCLFSATTAASMMRPKQLCRNKPSLSAVGPSMEMSRMRSERVGAGLLDDILEPRPRNILQCVGLVDTIKREF